MHIAMRRPDHGSMDDPGASQRAEGPWLRRRIEDAGLEITRRADGTLCVDPTGTRPCDDGDAEHVATLLPHGADDARSAVLLLPSLANHDATLLLNGFPPLGVTELSDRAEISLGGHTLYFYSKAETAAIEIFDGFEDQECARCKRPLQKGDAIRCCILCDSPHHEGRTVDKQLPDLLCASYDSTCARCREPWEMTTPDPEGEQHEG